MGQRRLVLRGQLETFGQQQEARIHAFGQQLQELTARTDTQLVAAAPDREPGPAPAGTDPAQRAAHRRDAHHAGRTAARAAERQRAEAGADAPHRR
ncbi:hypothetical protein G6F23_015482 [Rhizopus arrhizus]|nr:hypothetical protein G6F23_015482 [Rhizopus arrhizus]